MNGFQMSAWLLSSILLFLGAVFFNFCLRGYGYISAMLLFFMLLVLLHHFLPGNVWRVILVVVLCGFMYFCAVEIPIVKHSRGDRDCERKYLIVLGAAVHGDSPSLALEHRLEGAFDYLTAHPDTIAIVTGGRGKGENISEAECMYSYLIDNGISPERIITEDRAVSTVENLKFSFDIIRSLGDEPNGNVCIVSSAYHLFRAKCLAERLGVNLAAVPGNNGYPVYMLNCYIREAFGITHMMVFGW
ncbi:MAG: YdcF family protein [Eubacteriales bacterium]|nr:YdcF family protein [Eubacteriales bacterium]